MIYLELFWGFLKVGLFSFGGAYSAIPLIREVVLSYGWLDDEMLSYSIAVSESTPGPVMVNLATYAGSMAGGVLGAMIATFAVVLPAFVIILLVAMVLKNLLGNKWVRAILLGLTSCVIGIILSVGGYMAVENVFPNLSGFDLRAAILTVLLAVLYFGSGKLFKKKMSPILLIAVSAIAGAVAYSI